MHIPLDYYRVLGLPIQATSEQLNHAHRDRTLQLPRREFSEWAIAARRQLIDEAYEVLSDPTQRQPYDETFLSKPYDMSSEASPSGNSLGSATTGIEQMGAGNDGTNGTHPSSNPSSLGSPTIPRIEIHDNQFIGALLLLYELGEYELVLKLGRPYLSSGEKSLGTGQFGDPQIVGADIVLAIALSCLELGREQWQQGQYEAAAESLETGQELLLREGLFPTVRGEVQSDLYKLRPYRILELLALPEERAAERYQGLRLLQDILQERGGIDGKGNDQSGLSTDDFLRFIQQLRRYLSVAEQQQIFEAEANRPSAVGVYLAAYAFIAGGFAHRQPGLIQMAKQFVNRLGGRQNVGLEQSVCALLLGQTEEANYLVERSQEKETLAYIRKHSEGSPDLLPGLCLYAEQWLRAEVFPQFRDLKQEDASLKDYFADQTVQAYLEALPIEEDQVASAPSRQTASAPVAVGANLTTSRYREQEGAVTHQGSSYRPSSTMARSEGYTDQVHQGQSSGVGTMVGATATQDSRPSGYGNTALPTAERVSHLSPEGSLSHPNAQGNNDYALRS
ncbi:MAG: J domain-containing protein [Symploca sp. SIO2B6]|nr:J domain-containing protein [Symploca sp. SIO2B6]